MTQKIKRVTVPLDAASETGTAIDTAVRLAALAGPHCTVSSSKTRN